MDIYNFFEHVTYNCTAEVTKICLPLFKNFKITHFIYGKYYADNSHIVLSSASDWLKYYIANDYPVDMDHSSIAAGQYLGASYMPKEVVTNLRNLFAMDHIITFVEKYDDYIEDYCFAMSPNVSQVEALNLYFNNTDVLKRFVRYFKQQAASLIKAAERKRFLTPNDMYLHEQKLLSYTAQRANVVKDLLDKNIISQGESSTSITYRELDCLKYLAKGYTQKEAAKVLQISPRTVETHLNKLKIKLGCKRNAELIQSIGHLGIILD